MKGPLDIHQYLLAHDVHHEIVRLPRTLAGNGAATNLAQALGLPARRCVAVHPFHAPTKRADLLVLLLTPSDTIIDDAVIGQRLAKLLKGRQAPTAEGLDGLVRAGSQLVSSRTDYLAGHVAPLLLPPDVEVIALQSLADLATTVVYTPTGDAGTALGLRSLDLLVLSRATVLPADDRGVKRRPVRIELDPSHALEANGGPLAPAVSARRTPMPRRSAASVTPVAS